MNLEEVIALLPNGVLEPALSGGVRGQIPYAPRGFTVLAESSDKFFSSMRRVGELG